MPRRYLDEFPDYDEDGGFETVEEMRARLQRMRDQEDRDNFEPYRPPRGYRTEIKEMDQGWYWHLYRGDRRVNGGLADTWAGAQHAARSAIAAHVYAKY